MSHLRQIASMSRWIIGALAVAVTAIALTVTSASGSDPETQGEVAVAPDPAAFDKFRDCMSEHGADVPEPFGVAFRAPGAGRPQLNARPPGPPPAPRDAETRKAFEACSSLLPPPPSVAAFPGPPDPKAFNEFRTCMSDHGADVPKPPRGGIAPPPPPGAAPGDWKRPKGAALLRPSSAERQAFEACREKLLEPPDRQD
ncbi:MAG: hypothetical protein QOI10_2347 [Solirubrobacterales bacterium]|jgi:hypothetical protein|nr:hypothetical protein [Solirubrobacterales bacterium]